MAPKSIPLQDVNLHEQKRYHTIETKSSPKPENSLTYENHKIVDQQQHFNTKGPKRIIDDGDEYAYAMELY